MWKIKFCALGGVRTEGTKTYSYVQYYVNLLHTTNKTIVQYFAFSKSTFNDQVVVIMIKLIINKDKLEQFLLLKK